jgi:hypothetical protein
VVLEKAPLRSADDILSGYTTPPQNLLAPSGKSGSTTDAHAVATRPEHDVARPTTPQGSLLAGFVGFPMEQPRDARIQKIMDESRHRMLSAHDIRSLILSPDPFTERPDKDTPDWAIYKECPKQRRRAKNSDRWANSGGMKGSRDLPYNSPTPFVRRRYGSVFSHRDPSGKGKRYYEYTLLHQREDGTTYEDKSASLFHILPGPGETDRGRRVTANDNDDLCPQQPQNQIQPQMQMQSHIKMQPQMQPQMHPQLQMQPQMHPQLQMHPQPQMQVQLQPQLQVDTQVFAPSHQMLNTAMRESSVTVAPQVVPQQPLAASVQSDFAFVGMDMLSAVAALRSLGSETP